MISSTREATAASSPPTTAELAGDLAAPQNPDRAPALLALKLPRLTVGVRPMLLTDTRALEWHGGADLRRFYEEQWAAHRDGRVAALMADFNGFAVGQAAIHWHGKPTHPQIPDIQSLRVFAAFRGLGIGTLLVQAGEILVRDRGYGQVSLAVGMENPKARRLYERLGYQAVGESYNDVWHYTNAAGHTIRVEELVIDLVKTLGATTP